MQEKNAAKLIKFRERLEQALAARNLKQADLHRTLGFAQSTISRWKAGSIPRGATLTVLCNKLGVDPDWLTGESDDPGEPPTMEAMETRQERSDALETLGPEMVQIMLERMVAKSKADPSYRDRVIGTLEAMTVYLVEESKKREEARSSGEG